MKLQDLFPGSFRASHFDEPKTLTIAGIVPIAFEEDGEDRQKGKMTFRETSNYWIFGKEAAGELADQIQDDETDNWRARDDLLGVPLAEGGDGDRHHHPVDRGLGAVALEQLEEGHPLVVVGVLGGGHMGTM